MGETRCSGPRPHKTKTHTEGGLLFRTSTTNKCFAITVPPPREQLASIDMHTLGGQALCSSEVRRRTTQTLAVLPAASRNLVNTKAGAGQTDRQTDTFSISLSQHLFGRSLLPSLFGQTAVRW